MTDSLDDPFIQALMDKFAHLGYAVWFGLIEIIAKENKNSITGKLSISPTYLRRKLRTSPTKLREVFDYCQTSGKLLVNFSENNWDFDFPKIAEIKDNYTKDLQASCKKLAPYIEVEKEVEVDKRKNKTPSISAGLNTNTFGADESYFNSLWDKYPSKDGRKKALEHFKATVTDTDSWDAINKALANYLTHLKANNWKQPKNGRTWFNNWQDWVNWVEPGARPPESPPEEACTRCGSTNWISLKNMDKEKICDGCIKQAKQEGVAIRNGGGAVHPGSDTP